MTSKEKVVATSKENEKSTGAPLSKNSNQVVEDVRRLAIYALQTGQLPDHINVELIFSICEIIDKGDDITSKQFADIVDCYQSLERHFPTISARTLAATEADREPKYGIRSTSAGRYLFKLWWSTFFVVLTILLVNISKYYSEVFLPLPEEELTSFQHVLEFIFQMFKFLEPFLYGALGAFVYILRISEEKLHTREFDPARAAEHVNRLVLGTLSGGSIILFIERIPTDEGSFIHIGTAALGFLAGYSVEFLFQTVDRVINAILPKVGIKTIRQSTIKKRDKEIVKYYKNKLDEEKNQEVKKILNEFIDELESR